MGKMGRRPWYDKNGLKKGAWSQEEDEKLKSYIEKYGHSNWRQLPKLAGLSRYGKSCRLRWLNYLRQNLKRGNFSREEEDLIIKLQDRHGNKWADIATRLPGRTDNEIKNYWHSKLQKRTIQNSTSTVIRQPCEKSLSEANTKELEKEIVVDVLSQQTSEDSSFFSKSSSDGLSSFEFDYAFLSEINWFPRGEDGINSTEPYYDPIENFWSEPFLIEKTCNQNDFQSSTLEEGFMPPYIPYFDNGLQFSDQILMQELL
ncbi:hypothetical protein LguiB_002439 [Lonicera macranthoides]